MTLLTVLHELGLPMRGRYAPQLVTARDAEGEEVSYEMQQHVGWTTDQAKADAAREAGATVTEYRAHDPALSGWEVSVTERCDG